MTITRSTPAIGVLFRLPPQASVSCFARWQKIRGAHVIGVTSISEKAKAVSEAGADAIIISGQSDIAQEARRITGGRGVHVVYDGVGKDTFGASLDSLAPAGYLVIYRQSSGYVPPFDIMALQEKGSLFLTRTNGLPYLRGYPRYLQQLPAWLQAGKLSIRIHRAYPLAEAAQAPPSNAAKASAAFCCCPD